VTSEEPALDIVALAALPVGGVGQVVRIDAGLDRDTAAALHAMASWPALTGEISNVDGAWTVSRSEFCSFMASARNSCPA
jgi:hypothetical protein